MSGGGDRTWTLLPDAVWTGGSLLPDHAVVIEDGLVADVSASSARALPNVLRLDGCTLLPGLVDCHLHLADWMLPGLLAAGVTTVRDMGNDLDWILERRRRTADDPRSGPAIVACGPALDGHTAHWPSIGRSHADAGAVAASVAELGAAGVDAIKLYVNVDASMVESAVAAARRAELPVLAHLGALSAVEAVALGVSELEHLSGCVHHVDGSDQAALTGEVAGWAEAFLAADTVLCPTIAVWDRLSRVNDPVFLNDRRAEWVPAEVRSAWARFPHRTVPAAERTARQSSVVAMKSVLGGLHAAGCRIVAGSDAPFPGLPPGFGLHDELALLVDAGLTPAEALISATSAAADAVGLGGEVGRIERGLRADLLAVEGDPTSDIFDLGRVRTVVRAGWRLDPDDLRLRLRGAVAAGLSDPVTRLVMEAAGS